MKRNYIQLTLSILTILFISCSTEYNKETTEEPILSDLQLKAIDSVCQAFIDKGNTVGLSLALAHGDSVIFAKGYGLVNIETDQPATESTIYPIASISKFITAITTMIMVEQGKLSLDDKLIDYLEDFPRQEYMNEITIEHLLRHQSGLIDHEDWFDSIYIHHKKVFTTEEFYDFINQPLFFRPGTQYSYSNSGYAVLSMILEKITDQSFQDVIVENVGTPLQMQSLGMWPENWDRESATMGYELTEEGVDTSFHMMTEGMKGDGGLSANVVDLLKLVNGLKNETILSESSLNKILTPSPIGSIFIDYGLGVKMGLYNGQKCWGHSGGYQGIGWALLAHYPETDYTFAAAMNTSYSPEDAWHLRHNIMPIVFNLDVPNYKSQSIQNGDKYVGEYSSINRWGDGKPSVRMVTFEDGNLFWDNPDTETPGAQFFPIDENVFSWKAYPFDQFKFHEVDGKIVACSEYYDGLFGMVRMKENE